MSDQKHTPEPWSVELAGYWDNRDQYTVQGSNGVTVATMDAADGIEDDDTGEWGATSDANAERIVACVNACAGIADPAAFVAWARVAAVAWHDADGDYAESLDEMAALLPGLD